MKKLLLCIAAMLFTICSSAQIEYIYDFNNLTTGTQCLNGQDEWHTHYQTAGASQDFNVDYVADNLMSLDESIAVWYPYGGAGVGRTATRKASSNFNFNFQNGGNMDLEIDMFRNYWGVFFGVGFDSDNDGHILPGMTEDDGGVYLTAKSVSGQIATTLNLPNGNSIDLNYSTAGWTRYKLSFDFTAHNGAGSVTVFVKPDCTGEWLQLSNGTNINMGLTPGTNNKNDYHVWDGVFFHSQGGTGGFDNLLVRQQPDGNSQIINMNDIAKQLITNQPFELQATATSGLPVTFAIISGPATISGNILTLTGETGTVSLKAMQAGGTDNAGVEWLPAPNAIKTFEVIDALAYTPSITIRRPCDNSTVYMPQLNPILFVVSAYIEHPDALKIEDVTCIIDGDSVYSLQTEFPDDPENGYYFSFGTPDYGTHQMVVNVTTTGGKVSTQNASFEVVNTVSDIDVTTLNGDLICSPSVSAARGNYAMPTHVGAFDNINAHYDHNCVNGNCDTYDRVGGMRIRKHNGQWVELFRYISPFGVQCEADVDVTDFSTELQGLVEFEYYFESWNGSGFNPILTFNMNAGTPDHLYSNIDQVWYDTYAFGDYANPAPVPSVNYTFNDNADTAYLRLITTGHNWSSGSNNSYNTGNAAEFYEATHNININNTTVYTQHLWEICNPNPADCSPQNGTWIFNRAGWCPGSIGMVWNFDLSQYIGNQTTSIFYEFDPTYLDQCHPNYPDCVNGVTCTQCDAPDNPILKVAGQVISQSNNYKVMNFVNPWTYALDENINTLDIYPVPARDYVIFNTDYDKGKVCVHLFNMNGQEVKRFVFNGSTTLNVSDLPNGVYIAKVIGGKMLTKKIVIAR